MPKDVYVDYPANLVIGDKEIVFPNKYKISWDITKDWFSVFHNDFILVVHERSNVYARIGSLDNPEKLQVDYHLHLIARSENVIRGWLMADCFLISPDPTEAGSCLTIKYSRSNPDTFYGSNLCLPGSWATHLIVEEKGKYFALYDDEDDYTVVMDDMFNIYYSCRSVYYCKALKWKDDKLVLVRSSRWEDKSCENEIDTDAPKYRRNWESVKRVKGEEVE